MKAKLLRIALLIGILGIFFTTERKVSQAADYATEQFPHGIGRNMESQGLRVLGISYSVDGGVREYSYDVYNKNTGGDWEYARTRINDSGTGENIDNINDTAAFITVYNRSNSKHYQIHAARLRESLGDFSVVTHCYSKGEEVRSRKEYSFMTYSLNTGVNSVMTHNELSLGGFSAEEYSYAYNFYRPRALTAQTEVAVNTGEGKLERGGVAYYTEDGYYIKELPTTSLVKPGYAVNFLGWFDDREGGKQISAGTWCASGTTLYARWNAVPLSYEVTCYDISGNTSSGKVLGEHSWKAAYGAVVSGKTMGENKDMGAYYKGFTYTGDTTAVVSSSGATVYRYFAEHQYQISFDGNGASLGKMESIKNCSYTRQVTLTGNCFQKELRVVLDGNGRNVTCDTTELFLNRRFLGWADSPNGKVKYSDGAVVSELTECEEEITLYAVWSDEKLTVGERPQRFGYEFAGWSVEPDAERGMTQFSVEENMTLYAVWKPGTAVYHVEYYKENLDGHYDLVSNYSFKDFVDTEVEVTAEENIFQGYFLDKPSSVLSGVVRPDGSLILSAYYTRNKNQVSYHLNGGEQILLPEIVEKKYGEALTIWEETELTKEGYTFIGWSQEPDGKNQVYAPGESIKMPNHSMVLYAVWKPSSYQILFDGNGGGGTGSPQMIHAAYDEEIQLPVYRAEKAGYEFAGWNTRADGTGITYSCDKKVQNLCSREEKNITLYAIWKPISFEITYEANVNKSMTGKVKGIVRNTLYSFSEDSYASKEIYYLDGYQFNGWNTKADGTGKMFAPGEKITGQFTSKKENVLYAIWKLAENIGFQLEVLLEGTETPLETLQLYGKTGEKVSDALERIYKEELSEEDVTFFYPGYQIINREELEKTIQGDHSTKCKVLVKRRTCSLDYCAYQQGILVSIKKETGYAYQEKVILKDKLEYLGKERTVTRYVDNKENTYYPGESLILKRNSVMIPQFKIIVHEDLEDKGREEYCSWGKSYVLPKIEKAGYAFLGWYDKNGTLLGKEKDMLSGIETVELFPRWSEPLYYRITYDVEEQVLRILENKITKYQYQSEVKLPEKNQVAVLLENYEFAGWYLAEDEEQKIIDKISAGMYGDITLKAKLIKKSGEDNKKPDDNPGNGSVNDNKKPGSSDNPGDNNKPNQSIGVSKNPDVLSQKQDSQQNKNGKEVKLGTTFWKNNIKYRITSLKKGKTSVKIVGNRYRKKHLSISSKISYREKTYQVTAVGSKALYKNKYIKKIKISSSVCQIGSQAFANMKKLTQITFGKNVKVLGKKVCYKDTSLKKVIFKSPKIKKAGKKAFYGCRKLRKITGLHKQGRKLLSR